MACRSDHSRQESYSKNPLPKFRFISVNNSQIVSSDAISTNSPIVFIYFNPDCDHCQKETKSIIQHIEMLKSAQLYWISNDSLEPLRQFKEIFGFGKFSNAFICQDYKYSFYNCFLPSEVPYIIIYNKGGRLKRIFKGQTDPNFIIANTIN